MKARDILPVFNRGRISKDALARVDVGRVALSAEVQTNYIPRTLGRMMLRPGFGFLGECDGDGALIPFIYETDDNGIIELTPGKMRFWDGGETLVSRPAVSAVILNGTFDSSLTNWTDADAGSAASTWASGGYMQMLGDGFNSAKRYQAVTIGGGEEATLHALRIVVARGSAILRIGSSLGADDVFRQAVLRTGSHSIAFTPNNSIIYVEISTPLTYPVLIESVSIEAAGVMELPTPWATADQCRAVRWDQDGDVVFCAAGKTTQQRRIERRPGNSWSVTVFETTDGPFGSDNTENISITPSATSGEITLTASRSAFQPDLVGALVRLTSQGQLVSGSFSAELSFTDEIRITGVGSERNISVVRSGTWAGTISLQRSIGAPGSWVTVGTYTGNGTVNYNDGLSNSIVFYRIGFEAGNYTSGTATVSLEAQSGSIDGVCRITGYVTDAQVSAVVLDNLGGTDATTQWALGAWNDVDGWPTALAIWEGRLWWFAAGRAYGSVSDVFSSHDPNFEGDAGPINRAIGEGPNSKTNWALPLLRLIVGTDGRENGIRSNSFDEPVTPSNYNSKPSSTKGSAAVPAVLADKRGYFIDRSGIGLFEMKYSVESYDFDAQELTLLIPEITKPGVIRMAVQQRPDRRVHCVKSDGTVAMLVRDEAEDVLAWVDVETSGSVEDVVVLPGLIEDEVYYRVARTVNGVTRRYLERWALEDECKGGTLSKCADSFVTGSGPVAGLGHLEGRSVVIWGDGADQGEGVVIGGAVSGHSYTTWCAGLHYRARYKSAKLAGESSLGLSLSQRCRVNKIGLILADTHRAGVKYGPDFETMDDLPLVEDGLDVAEDTVWEEFDQDMIEFPGEWDTDNRVCLESNAPRPATILAAILNVDRQDAA